jgi:tetratricopeptide (TPR) repeat protein
VTDEVAPVSAEDDDLRYAPTVSDDGELVVEDFQSTPSEGYGEPPTPRDSLWTWLRKTLFASGEERRLQNEQRLAELDRAIEYYPETPSNYVLRGELYLETSEYELAAADFNRALEYAAAQIENEDWAIISQVMQDRAQIGLEIVQRQLNKRI